MPLFFIVYEGRDGGLPGNQIILKLCRLSWHELQEDDDDAPCWCSGSGAEPDWAAVCCLATLMPVLSLSLSPLKWAKNNLPRCRGHELEGTPCPLLESTCSNYCSPTSSHGSCAEIAEDNMTKWCKPESRQIHHPPLGWGWVSLVRARMKDRRLCALLHVSAVASLHCWIVMKGVLV